MLLFFPLHFWGWGSSLLLVCVQLTLDTLIGFGTVVPINIVDKILILLSFSFYQISCERDRFMQLLIPNLHRYGFVRQVLGVPQILKSK